MFNKLIIYILAVNIFVFILMGIDKFLAIRNYSRIPEKHLLLLGVFLGGFGGLISMKAFKHKTSHFSFKLCFFIGIILTFFVLIYGGFYG